MNTLRLLVAMGLLTWPAFMKPVVGASRRPSLWARLILVSLVTGSTLLVIALAHEILPGGLILTGRGSVAEICLRIGGHLLALLPGGGWLASVLLAVVLAGGWRGVAAARRSWRTLRVEPVIGTHLPVAGGELVVLPISGHLAFGVPGSPRQVVVSQSVVDRLAPTELDSLVRHETAHLDLHHHRFLLAGAAIQGALGLVRPVRGGIDVLRLSLERWADEEASGGSWRHRTALRAAMVALGVRGGRVRWDPDMVAPRLQALSVSGPVVLNDVWWWLALGIATAVTFSTLTGSMWVHLARLALLAG